MLAATLLLLLGALWLARTTVLGAIAERVLASRGLGPAHLDVLSVTPSRLQLAVRGSALGSIEHLAVDYRLAVGSGLAVQRVALRGARLEFAWRDGALHPTLGESGGDGAPSASAMTVELEDVQLRLRVGAAQLDTLLAGTLTTGAAPAAQLAFKLRAAQGQLQGSVSARSPAPGVTEVALAIAQGDIGAAPVLAQGVSGELHGRLRAGGIEQLQGRFALRQLVTGKQAWGAATLRIAQPSPDRVTLDLDSAALHLALRTALPSAAAPRAFSLDTRLDARFLAALLPALRVDAGELTAHIEGELPAPPITLDSWLQGGHLHAAAHLAARHVVVPGLAEVDSARAALDCDLASGALSCTSRDGVALQGGTLAAAQGQDHGLVAGELALAVRGVSNAPLLLVSRRDGVSSLAAHAALTLETAQLVVRAPVDARLSFAPAEQGGHYSFASSIAAEHPPAQAWLAPRVELAGRYRLDAAHTRLESATLAKGVLDLAAQGWSARGVEAQYRVGDSLRVSIGELRSTREPAVLTPLAASLKAHLARDAVSFDAIVNDADHRLELAVHGRHRRRSGNGDATLSMKPIVLDGASGLATLTPALAATVHDARGTISATATTYWGAGAPPGTGSLTLHEIGFSAPAFKLSALNGALTLDNLTPPHSGAGQRLEATLELPSLKRVPVSLRYSIGAQRVMVEQARAEVFDGAFEVRDGAIDIAGGASRMDLEVKDVDLASAFTVLNLEQLHGSGRLSGRLPLTLEGGHFAVTGGQLQTSGPGVVKIGASAVTDQLKSYGKDVDLAFSALSDFHYDSLSIAADKPLLGAGKALFHMQGNNPAVMDGQPFIFNISLETDFDYLAALLLQLSGITNSALGWGAGAMLKQ